MKAPSIFIFLVGYGLLSSCSTEPVPIEFGKDDCYFCKMTLMDNKFGAEIVTAKGKVYKFDDMNCFLKFYHLGFEEERNMKYKLVIDYATPGKLIDARDAFFVKSESLRTPMNSGIAAFENKASMDTFKKESSGIYLGWGEVITQFK